MNLRRHILEAITLILAAVICATVANALASRERKMALVGAYPNALEVPAVTVEQPVVAPVTTTTTTTTAPETQTQPASVPLSVSAVPPPVPVAKPAQKTETTETQRKPEKPAVDVSKFQPHPDKQYLEVAYADVAALHAAGALILDARRTSIYEQGHIAGARPFSVWEADVDQKVNQLFEERSDPKDQARPIVIYCSGGECEDSHMLASKLWGVQFNNVYVYKDGFPDWEKRGGPVHTGANP